MPLSASQIVSLACQDAAVPGYTSQGGQLLNAVLQELCQTYDLDVAKGTYVFNFNPGLATNPLLYPNVQPGGGPYPLPGDFLRMVNDVDNVWYLNGVPYPMIPVDLSEYDNFVQQPNVSSYPYVAATDMSQSPPNLLVWPPASGAFQVMLRYRRQMPDIQNPETSAAVPWFPFSQYLRTRLAGELMKISDDTRADNFLGDGPAGAQGLLNRYLKLKDDSSNRAKMVSLDRRIFKAPFSRLPNTKSIGWLVTFALFNSALLHAVLNYVSA